MFHKKNDDLCVNVLLLGCRLPVTQIQGCDAILARMQEMLLGFQADLGGISDEIKHLQVQKDTKLLMSSRPLVHMYNKS